MSVRIDDDRGAATAASPTRSYLPMIVLGGVCLALVVALVTVMLQRGSTTGAQPPPPATSPSTASPSTSSSSASPAGYTWPTEPVLEQVAPGLDRCQTTTEGLNANAINGIGYQWEASQQGGIAAAMEHLEFRFGPTFLNQQSFTNVTRTTISGQYGLTGELTTALNNYRQSASLNEQGEIVDPATGKVNQGQAWMTGAYPRYGAYRLLSYTTAAGKPDDLLVSIWLPVVDGPASAENVSEVNITWAITTVLMVWEDDDWKVAAFRYAPDSPAPADPSFVNQTFETRAQTLGPGWCVTADATEQNLPGVVKGR